jgi:hypothetical protein
MIVNEVPKERECTVCKKTLPLTNEFFHKQKAGLGGLKARCKSCESEAGKKYRSKPGYKEEHARRAREWRKKNPEKHKEARKRAYAKHSAEYNAKRNWRYHNDPEYRAKKQALDKKRTENGSRRKSAYSKKDWERHLAARKKYARKTNAAAKYYSKTKVDYTDSFIKARILSNISRYSDVKFTVDDITPEMIELKRKQLKLLHNVKEKSKNRNGK